MIGKKITGKMKRKESQDTNEKQRIIRRLKIRKKKT